jgi:hypothetical protein
VFGNSPDFWLNVQRRTALWEAMNSPRERERIERAKRLVAAVQCAGRATLFFRGSNYFDHTGRLLLAPHRSGFAIAVQPRRGLTSGEN